MNLEELKNQLSSGTNPMEDQLKSKPSEVTGDDFEQTRSGLSANKPKMPVYIGTKVIQAIPMTQEDFLKQKGEWQDGQETYGDGYLVRYDDGYRSWSPKDVFERCYRQLTQQEIHLIY